MVDISKLPYRDCVGMMVLNAQRQVFMAQRIDTRTEAWQMPQGGVDAGEDITQAALRELLEEIGTNHVEILTEHPEWLYYDIPADLVPKLWGGKYRGQRQRWFLMRFWGDDAEINLETEHPEFHAWQWVELNEVAKRIVPFKRDLYEQVVAAFRPFIQR